MREKLRLRLESCAIRFGRDTWNVATDRAVAAAFKVHPKNNSLDDTLHKVAVLNSLYHTGILDVFKMAKHVLTQDLDSYLADGNLKAVDLLRQGHGIRTKKGRERDFYSFASKYCHWHRPKDYPIFDQYAARALRWVYRQQPFCDTFSSDDLYDFPHFKSVVDALRSSLNPGWGYKRLDQALWILGQEI